jgi:hypothetical protein
MVNRIDYFVALFSLCGENKGIGGVFFQKILREHEEIELQICLHSVTEKLNTFPLLKHQLNL